MTDRFLKLMVVVNGLAVDIRSIQAQRGGTFLVEDVEGSRHEFDSDGTPVGE